MKKHLVILPYNSEKAQGDELITAVRAWHRFAQFPFQMVVVGEMSDATKTLLDEKLIGLLERPNPDGGVRELEFARIATSVVILFGDRYDSFIKTDDDIYPVNPFTYEDVKIAKWMGNTLKGDIDSLNYHLRAMARTRELLKFLDKPIDNYCSHAPRVYEMAKLRAIMKYALEEPHLIEPLYFNMYSDKNAPRLNLDKEGRNYKYRVEENDRKETILKAIHSGVKWLNNTVESFSPEILSIIHENTNRK